MIDLSVVRRLVGLLHERELVEEMLRDLQRGVHDVRGPVVVHRSQSAPTKPDQKTMSWETFQPV